MIAMKKSAFNKRAVFTRKLHLYVREEIGNVLYLKHIFVLNYNWDTWEIPRTL
jgi:hypothetical protein